MLLEKLDVLCSVEPMVGMLHICTEWKKVLMEGVIRLFKLLICCVIECDDKRDWKLDYYFRIPICKC
jgi:hypothetical protein